MKETDQRLLLDTQTLGQNEECIIVRFSFFVNFHRLEVQVSIQRFPERHQNWKSHSEANYTFSSDSPY